MEIIQDNTNQKYELASRKRRFFAFIVDLLVFFTILFFVLRWYPIQPEEIAKNVPYIEILFNKSAVYRTTITMIIHFLVNYFFLLNGQTIGKWLLTIQVADVQGKVASIWRMYFLRDVIFWYLIFISQLLIAYILQSYRVFSDNTIRLLVELPFCLFYFINILFIYRKDRRCIHDFFAGTIVIKLPT